MNVVYVTGHRNPDTDSIVSAIAYAALRNALGDREYQAACLGRVSDETQAVLDRFHFKAPQLLRTVRTQVYDLEYDTPPTIDAGVTVSRAWQTIHSKKAEGVAGIPVANEDGTLYGMLSAGDIATYDMGSVRNADMGNLPLYNVLSVLEAQGLNKACLDTDHINGEVVVALPYTQAHLLNIGPNSIVICGDQPDMIASAMDAGANCVIVCQAEVPQELVKRDSSTCLIATSCDAYTTVRLLCHCAPVSRICGHDEIVCFHLSDYIDDVREIILKSRFRSYPILNEYEQVVGTLSRFHLIRPRRKQVVLMDHNEAAQSVPNLDQADILEIIDHHRLADIQTGHPIYFRNEPVGSTTTIVAGMYQERGLMPSEKMAGLMAAAIVSDTVMFKSPTCTQRDIDMATRMARMGKTSLEELGQLIFSAGISDTKSGADLLMQDFKEFHIAGHDLAVAQITCAGSERMVERKKEFLNAMTDLLEEKEYDAIILMITDVLKEGSVLVSMGDEQIIEQAFNCKVEEHLAFLPGIMSRKKQIIPALSAIWG